MFITHRDYVANGYRRQEMMARADQHRLVQNLLNNKGYQEAGNWHRSLGRVGELLMVLGQWMQIRYPIDTMINRAASDKTSEGLATARARGNHFAPLLISPSEEHSPLNLHLAALC